MSESEMVEVIRQKVSSFGSLRLAAKEWGVSPAYLSFVLSGKSRPGKSVVKALGYHRVVQYRKATPQ